MTTTIHSLPAHCRTTNQPHARWLAPLAKGRHKRGRGNDPTDFSLTTLRCTQHLTGDAHYVQHRTPLLWPAAHPSPRADDACDDAAGCGEGPPPPPAGDACTTVCWVLGTGEKTALLTHLPTPHHRSTNASARSLFLRAANNCFSLILTTFFRVATAQTSLRVKTFRCFFAWLSRILCSDKHTQKEKQTHTH